MAGKSVGSGISSLLQGSCQFCKVCNIFNVFLIVNLCPRVKNFFVMIKSDFLFRRGSLHVALFLLCNYLDGFLSVFVHFTEIKFTHNLNFKEKYGKS